MTLSLSHPGFNPQVGYNVKKFRLRGGYSLTGKTAILHIVILGSSPNISILVKAREAQSGRAELWRCLGCKFKSYLEHEVSVDVSHRVKIYFRILYHTYVCIN